MNSHLIPFDHTSDSLFVIKKDGQYYTTSKGLRSYEEAERHSTDGSIIYQVVDGVLVSCTELPSDIIEHEISKYLDDQNIAQFVSTSKKSQRILKREIVQRKINARRSLLNYIDVDHEYDYEDLKQYTISIKPRFIPIPKLPYGVPDIDVNGEPILENIQSNDDWIMLASLFDNVTDFEEVFKVVSIDMIEDLFRYGLLDPLITSTDGKYNIIDIVEHHNDLIRLLSQIPNVKMKRFIYENVESAREQIDDHFVKSGLFDDLVYIDSKTIDLIMNEPNYPKNHLRQIVLSPLFHEIDRFYDDALEALRHTEYFYGFELMKDMASRQIFDFNFDVANILIDKAIEADDLKNFGTYWINYVSNLNDWSGEHVIRIFDKIDDELAQTLVGRDDCWYPLTNRFDGQDKEILENYFSSRSINAHLDSYDD